MSDTALFLFQEVSLIMFHPITNSMWVTLLNFFQAVSLIMFHPMANRMWVTLLYFFARQSHQSCFIPWPTGCEWHCFISLPGSLIDHVSSHDQQGVSDTTLFLCQVFSHKSCIIPWLATVCEWLSLLNSCARQSSNSHINHVLFQQIVSLVQLFIE